MTPEDHDTLVLGPEWDDALRDRVLDAIRLLGWEMHGASWGVAGSQELTEWSAKTPLGALRFEAETYMGLAVSGPRISIAELRAELLRSDGNGRMRSNNSLERSREK